MLCTYDAMPSINVESVFLFGFLDSASATSNNFPGTYCAIALYLINLSNSLWHHIGVVSMSLSLMIGIKGL